MKNFFFLIFFAVTPLLFAQPAYDYSQLKREKLGRGVVAVRESVDTVFVAWRYLSSDAMKTAFNIYRNGKKINSSPVKEVTFYQNYYPGNEACVYTVVSVKGKKE